MHYRVAFDAPTTTDNGQGGTIQGWQERHCCAAAILFLRGGETVQAARLAGRQPAVVTVRVCAALADLATDWRVRDVRSGAVYNVRAVIRTDDRAFYEVTCEGGVAA